MEEKNNFSKNIYLIESSNISLEPKNKLDITYIFRNLQESKYLFDGFYKCTGYNEKIIYFYNDTQRDKLYLSYSLEILGEFRKNKIPVFVSVEILKKRLSDRYFQLYNGISDYYLEQSEWEKNHRNKKDLIYNDYKKEIILRLDNSEIYHLYNNIYYYTINYNRLTVDEIYIYKSSNFYFWSSSLKNLLKKIDKCNNFIESKVYNF